MRSTVLYAGHALEACGSCYPEANTLVQGACPFRSRGMAVDPSAQGKGVGRALFEHAWTRLREEGCDVLWCNAREAAIGFYRSTA